MASQSIEVTGSQRAGTGSDTGKGRRRALAEEPYASDPKFKKYGQQVERCLNSFENVQEWADCIAFLKQLLKTFQSYMQFKDIPRKLIVAKRLSQCLNPALPTGVHQRALDVYSHIFAVIGPDGLRRDLQLWSLGLFPFFEYAATAVKPILINMYETHYVPLQGSLRPVMKSFILCLLPGLEEETGEYFDKVMGLLDQISGTVSPSFFLQNVWLIMLTTPTARHTALNLLSRRLPRMKPEDDITPIVGRDTGLVIRAFAAALEDDDLLVRRAALDLLVQSLRPDSLTVRTAPPEDRTILMRAAYSVVLRRDLSLNRRLYSWLLGTDERSESQIEYLRKHSLDLLEASLKDEMLTPHSAYSTSRPFKIFISLLDKWEIGHPLTESLVIDAFQAVKAIMSVQNDPPEDIVMTSSTLYEAIEPLALWKHLLSRVADELLGEKAGLEGIRLARFILKTFPHDEEVASIHMPIILAALTDLLRFQLHAMPTKIYDPIIVEVLHLFGDLIQHLVTSGVALRPLEGSDPEGLGTAPYAFACKYYGSETKVKTGLRSRINCPPVISCFEDFIDLSLILAQAMETTSKPFTLLDVIVKVAELQSLLLDKLDDYTGTLTFAVSWAPASWVSVMLGLLQHEAVTFSVVDHLVTLALALHRSQALSPKLELGSRSAASDIVNKLLGYLRSDYSGYHARAVALIWILEAATSEPHVESVIAQSLANAKSNQAQTIYDAFGVLWRLTEDSTLPGFRLKIPLYIVLDSLKSDDLNLRRIGETWMRCSLRSYIRVLDPILHDLLDPNVVWVSTTVELNGKQLQGFTYEHTMDQRFICHLLEILQSVIRFGGQGFAKTARSTLIDRSLSGQLKQRIETAFSRQSASYMDIILDLLLRLLSSEPKGKWSRTMGPMNSVIQSITIDVLQSLVGRGEVDQIMLETIQATVISKLYLSIHMGKLDIQNKLLHLLHSLISAMTSEGHEGSSRQAVQPSANIARRLSQETARSELIASPLLVQVLIDGITMPTNRPLLQHWLDFILMTIPPYHAALKTTIAPLNDCLCRQIHAGAMELNGAMINSRQGVADVRLTVTDAEFLMFLNALEKLVLLSLSKKSSLSQPEEDVTPPEKATQDGVGLFGYVSTVFSSEGSTYTPDEQLTARSPGYRALHQAVRVLFTLWTTLIWADPSSRTSMDESLSIIYQKTRSRCRRVLEHLYKAHSSEVLESVAESWVQDSKVSEDIQTATFELMDSLAPSAHSLVQMLCESISCRMTGMPERSRRQALNPNLSGDAIFAFLEQYLHQLEGPLVSQVWPRFLQLAKDVASNWRDYKLEVYPALRCTTVLAEKLAQGNALEDKRLRRDLQETYIKLLEASVSLASREPASWVRRSTKDSLTASGRASPIPRANPDVNPDEKSMTPPQQDQAAPSNVMPSQIVHFVATSALPKLRKILVEPEKILSACQNIVYYVISPSLKSKARPMDVDPQTIEILKEMARIPAALKAWRGPVLDILNDARVFNSTPAAGARWKPVVAALIDTDKTAFPELLGKIASAPSANIFTNREYEMLLQSLSLRRLSFVLFTGEKNHFLTQLPSVIEKLVDILRNVTSPVVQSDLYLCLRVLICRLSAHNLTSFWPVILTELYRIFDSLMTDMPADGSEELPLILAASKFLDLLLVLQTSEFQIHQWIFITDTVDAIYRPDNWYPEAILDRLAEVAADLTVSEVRDATASTHMFTPPAPRALSPALEGNGLRQPLLNDIRQIDSLRDLLPFFSHVSIASYESVYASEGNVDWEAVERGILADMFDGRSP